MHTCMYLWICADIHVCIWMECLYNVCVCTMHVCMCEYKYECVNICMNACMLNVYCGCACISEWMYLLVSECFNVCVCLFVCLMICQPNHHQESSYGQNVFSDNRNSSRKTDEHFLLSLSQQTFAMKDSISLANVNQFASKKIIVHMAETGQLIHADDCHPFSLHFCSSQWRCPKSKSLNALPGSVFDIFIPAIYARVGNPRRRHWVKKYRHVFDDDIIL